MKTVPQTKALCACGHPASAHGDVIRWFDREPVRFHNAGDCVGCDCWKFDTKRDHSLPAPCPQEKFYVN